MKLSIMTNPKYNNTNLQSVICQPLSKEQEIERLIWDNDEDVKIRENVDSILSKEDDILDNLDLMDKRLIKEEYKVIEEIANFGGIILDNGCGTGRHLIKILLANKKTKVIGIDISYLQLKVIEEKVVNLGFQDRVKLFRASLDEMFFIENNSVDSAVCMYRTFGNLTEKIRQKNLQEVQRVLRPNGLYFLSVGNKDFMKDRIKHNELHGFSVNSVNYELGDVDYGVPQHFFTPEEITQLLKINNFIIEKIKIVPPNIFIWAKANK